MTDSSKKPAWASAPYFTAAGGFTPASFSSSVTNRDKQAQQQQPTAASSMMGPRRAPEDDEDEEDEVDDDPASYRPSFGATSSSVPTSFGSLSFPPPKSYDDDDNVGTAPTMGLGRGFVPTSEKGPVLRDDAPSSAAPRKPVAPSAFSAKASKQQKAQSFGARMMAKMGYVAGQGLGKDSQGRSVIVDATLRPQRAGLGAVREKSEADRREEKRQRALRKEAAAAVKKEEGDEESSESESDESVARGAGGRHKRKHPTSGISSGASSGAAGRGTPTPKRAKRAGGRDAFGSVEQIRRALPGLHVPEALATILDLTGREAKTVSSVDGFIGATRGATAFETAEQAAARRAAARARSEMLALLDEYRALDQRIVEARIAREAENRDVMRLEGDLARLRIVEEKAKALEDGVATGGGGEAGIGREGREGGSAWEDRWRATVQALKEMQAAVRGPSVKVALSADVMDMVREMAVAAIHPLMSKAIATWDPLETPDLMAPDLLSIKDLFKYDVKEESALIDRDAFSTSVLGAADAVRQHRRHATPYENMMYKVWFPKAAAAIREWNPHDPYPMLSFFELWQNLLPEFVGQQVLEQNIVRRLGEAISDFNPRKSKHHPPTHLWIFPWLQHLPPHHSDPASKFGLVSDIRRKHRQLIDSWRFDKGIIPDLKEWKPVYEAASPNQWQPLVVNHVLPAMATYLRRNFEVDLTDQETYLPALAGVLEWLEMLPENMIAEVIVAEVFPKWHDALYRWLVSDDPDYDEIAQWLEWWRDSVFPDEIKALPTMAAEFDKGAVMVMEALGLGDSARTELARPGKAPAYKPHKISTRAKDEAKRAEPPLQQPTARPPPVHEEKTFRSRLEDWCAEQDIQFLQERRRTHRDGHALFRLTARMDGKGGALIYFLPGVHDVAFIEGTKGAADVRITENADDFLTLYTAAMR